VKRKIHEDEKGSKDKLKFRRVGIRGDNKRVGGRVKGEREFPNQHFTRQKGAIQSRRKQKGSHKNAG